MDIYKPVSTIMSTNLITVAPEDKLSAIKDIFKEHRIHHIPVVSGDKLIGILSKSDFLNATHGVTLHGDANEENEEIYNTLKVSDLMIKGIAKISSSDHIAVAIELFLENLFHAVPIVDEDTNKLVGIVTTYDIMKLVMKSHSK